jgi:hypothetical protein
LLGNRFDGKEDVIFCVKLDLARDFARFIRDLSV